MRKYISLTILFLATLFVTSCIDDKTETEFEDLILPTIDNPELDPDLFVEDFSYRVAKGDTLMITPKIKYDGSDELTYSWRINGEVVSNEKDLSWICDLNDKAAAAFIITRKQAGNSEILPFLIILDEPFEKGFNIAVDKGGIVEYNFLREVVASPMYKYEEFGATLNTGFPATNFLKSFEYWSNESASVKGKMFHLSTDGEQSWNINALSMVSELGLRDEFIGEEIPQGVRFKEAMYCGYVTYLIDETGNCYVRRSQKGYYTGRYSSLPIRYENRTLNIGAVAMGPYRMGFGLLFDQEQGRFYAVRNHYDFDAGRHPENLAGTILPITEASGLNKLQGKEVVYTKIICPMASYLTEYGLFFITKDQGGNFHAHHYKLELNGENIGTPKVVYENAVLEHYGENSMITALDNDTYGEGKIYYSNTNQPSQLLVTNYTGGKFATPQIYHDFGASIVALENGKVMRTGKYMCVATEANEVTVLSLAPSMTKFIEDKSQAHKWKLKDKILHVDYRYGTIGAY